MDKLKTKAPANGPLLVVLGLALLACVAIPAATGAVELGAMHALFALVGAVVLGAGLVVTLLRR